MGRDFLQWSFCFKCRDKRCHDYQVNIGMVTGKVFRLTLISMYSKLTQVHIEIRNSVQAAGIDTCRCMWMQTL